VELPARWSHSLLRAQSRSLEQVLPDLPSRVVGSRFRGVTRWSHRWSHRVRSAATGCNRLRSKSPAQWWCAVFGNRLRRA
jgi:hypothetical protein